jgi:hypothetical protein
MPDLRPSILVVTLEVAESDVDELDRWYREEHGPEKMALPGYIGMRRFRAFDGSPRFLVVYELEDPEVAMRPRTGSPESTETMRQIMSKWKQWERNVWVEVESTSAEDDTAHGEG